MSTQFKTKCPFCGFENDMVTPVLGALDTPEDGAISFCFTCGEFSLFDSSREENLRVPTPGEKDELMSSDECQKIQMAWNLVMGEIQKH